MLGGTALLRKGQLRREIVIILFDDDDAEDTREKIGLRDFQLVLKNVRNGELSTTKPTVCTITIKSKNMDYTGFMDSKPFQIMSGLFTLYALFGSDIVILAMDPSLDMYFEVRPTTVGPATGCTSLNWFRGFLCLSIKSPSLPSCSCLMPRARPA